jgi:hypothetical protein
MAQEGTSPASSWRSTALLFALSVVLSFVVLEMGLRIATPFPINEVSNRAPHPRYGYVLLSRLPEIDARGFRDPDLELDDAEVVVLGDSQVYSFNVRADASFPALLGQKTGRPVYNMGIPSWGIYNYMVVLEELASHPIQDVVLGLYPANDLSFPCAVIELPYWEAHARHTVPGLSMPEVDCDDGDGAREEQRLSLKQRLERASALVGALDYFVYDKVRRLVMPHELEVPAYRFPESQQVERARVRGHARGTSLDDPRVRADYENSLRILRVASRRFAEAGIGFAVVLIPSREAVVYEWARRNGFEMEPGFVEGVAPQLELTRAWARFFEREGIPYTDALPHVTAAFEDEARAGRFLYPLDDGHPFERGYDAYAEAAVEALEKLRPAEGLAPVAGTGAPSAD